MPRVHDIKNLSDHSEAFENAHRFDCVANLVPHVDPEVRSLMASKWLEILRSISDDKPILRLNGELLPEGFSWQASENSPEAVLVKLFAAEIDDVLLMRPFGLQLPFKMLLLKDDESFYVRRGNPELLN